MKEMFDRMQEARRRAFVMIRAGVSCAEMDCSANDFLRQEGMGDSLLHRTGHGFGLSNHEGPWIAGGSREVLAKNMLISIEPGIYVPNLGGFRHSDTVLVTEAGYERLTQSPADLSKLTLTGRKFITQIRGALVRKAVGV
jgi:Xaa-Pro aminopeptidase